MYSKGSRSRRKSKVGSVQYRSSNNRLQLVFTFGGKRNFLSTGLSDTPYNRKLVQDKALEIERDIRYGEFDVSLEKYKPDSVLSTVDPITPLHPSAPTLAELWVQYMEYRSLNASPKTINGTYELVTAHLSKCSTDGLKDALKFRLEPFNNSVPSA